MNFDVFGVNVRLEFGESVSPPLQEQVRKAWSGAMAPASEGDVTVSLTHANDEVYMESLSSRVTLAALELRGGEMMLFHAAGIAHSDGRVLAFVGPSGRGKTTLSRALARHFAYVSDETIAVADDLTVYPYRKPLSVKRKGKPKEQVSPASQNLLELPPAPLRLAKVVILDRRKDVAQATIEAVPLAEAFEALVPETSYLARLDAPLQRFASILEQCGGAVGVVYAEADTLLDLVPELLEFQHDDTFWRPAMPTSEQPDETRLCVGDVCDAIEVDDATLVLTNGGVLHVLAGVAPELWAAACQGNTEAEALQRVISRYGTPDEGDPEALVAAMLQELADAQLVQRPAAG